MEKVCVDDVFGKMTYNHRWYKIEEMEFFGKKWPVTIAAKAYSENLSQKSNVKVIGNTKMMNKKSNYNI